MIDADQPGPTPDFKDWVDAWFVDSSEFDEDEGEGWNLCTRDLAEYYARLFENPAFLVERFTRDQLAAGLWKLCGIQGSWHKAMDPSTPEAARHRCHRAIGTLYTDLFDPMCVSIPDEMQDNDSFCVAVYMIWDMDTIDIALTHPEFREDCISVLQVALHCQSAACVRSGLHGIGHWIQRSEHRRESELVALLRSCIDHFLIRYRQKVDASPSMIAYALNARSGNVM